MYKLIVPFLLLVSCSVRPHPGNNKLSATGTFNTIKKINDTLFISREVTKDNYCAVYIEQNRRSVLYNDLLDFKMDSDENVMYRENYNAIKTHNPAPYKTYDLFNLPRRWVPLYIYKNKYYLYYPSERGAMSRKIITDSTLTYWYMDGQSPEPIKSLNKTSPQTWCFKIHPYDSNTKLKEIMLHIIDPKNQIAVWEDTSMPGNNRYELCVAVENARNFDMVVNFCTQNKTGEFIFEVPDYKTLLKGR